MAKNASSRVLSYLGVLGIHPIMDEEALQSLLVLRGIHGYICYIGATVQGIE